MALPGRTAGMSRYDYGLLVLNILSCSIPVTSQSGAAHTADLQVGLL